MTKEQIKFFIDNEETIFDEIDQRLESLGREIELPDDISAENIRDVYAGGLRGFGDTKYIAKYTILTDIIFKVILSYICVNILKFDLVSIWVIVAVQECLKAIIFYKRVYSNSWKNIKVINNL